MKELSEQELSEVSGGKHFVGDKYDYPEGPAPVQGLFAINAYDGPKYIGKYVYVVLKSNNEKWAYGKLKYSYEKKNCTAGVTTKRYQGIIVKDVSYKLRALGGDVRYDSDWVKPGMYYEFYDGNDGIYQLYLAE